MPTIKFEDYHKEKLNDPEYAKAYEEFLEEEIFNETEQIHKQTNDIFVKYNAEIQRYKDDMEKYSLGQKIHVDFSNVKIEREISRQRAKDLLKFLYLHIETYMDYKDDKKYNAMREFMNMLDLELTNHELFIETDFFKDTFYKIYNNANKENGYPFNER